MSTPFIDTIRRVFNSDGYCIEVGPAEVGPGFIELRTVGKDNEEYFGVIRVTMPSDFAVKLAAALEACAEEAQL